MDFVRERERKRELEQANLVNFEIRETEGGTTRASAQPISFTHCKKERERESENERNLIMFMCRSAG